MVYTFNPPATWQPFGPFSMATVQGDGHVVYLKGQVSLDRGGNLVGRGDMPAQLHQTLKNIHDVLASMGGELSDTLSLVHYVTDIDAFMGTSDIRKLYFVPPYPVTTTVQVQRLYRTDLLIEIAAIAEIPRSRFKRPAVP